MSVFYFGFKGNPLVLFSFLGGLKQMEDALLAADLHHVYNP